MAHRVPALIAAIALSAPLGLAAPQTADDLVNLHLAAKGGLERLKAIQSMKQTVQITRAGMSMSMVLYGKRPNLARQELSFGGKTMVMVFDGTAAWMINPFGGSSEPVALTGPQSEGLREQATLDLPLMEYKARGMILELVGTEESGGRRLHHLKLTNNAGKVQHIYLDAITNLEARVTSDTPNGPAENWFSNFKDVSGVKMPFAIETVIGGKVEATIKVLSIEINPTLDDALFKVK